jgi:hypothetical protein
MATPVLPSGGAFYQLLQLLRRASTIVSRRLPGSIRRSPGHLPAFPAREASPGLLCPSARHLAMPAQPGYGACPAYRPHRPAYVSRLLHPGKLPVSSRKFESLAAH